MFNPLLEAVERIVLDADELPLTEHELLSRLVDVGVLRAGYARDTLSLFQAHFLAMNALYTVREALRYHGRELQVDPLCIVWYDTCNAPAQGSKQVSDVDHLAAYYLDWSHFSQASQDSVDELLNGFWNKYLSTDQQDCALEVLGLCAPVEWSDVKARYRTLAMQCHPDRGGEAARFNRLQEAYQLLKQSMKDG